ncbi:hypothetical protein PMZ80_004467 [Knufia obscura]|uniref:F-box domain-containing protein n=1 Tax=Knufia obscura TaxID=1635080 RepID=A0ABR0RT72_9EURO|nr:hypothetical protein PMZ80_004467 [Knufia obscura]
MARPIGNRIWPMDEAGRSTFLRIPQDVDLNHQKQQKDLSGGPSSIANLPPELHGLILSHLPAIDRACLALTCKSLAASAITSPHLRASPWTPWLFFKGDQFPSRHLLIQRLAHGWIDKSRLRYCQNCQRILPRDPGYFRQKLQKKKKLPWNIKVELEEEKWKRLSNNKKYEHILKTWSESSREDSSIFSCNKCLTREMERTTGWERDLEKALPRQAENEWGHQVPVECPCCVVHSLTNTYKEPRKPKFRPWLWKWTKRVGSFVGNTILVFVYLIYLLFKAPIDIGMWLWKKKTRSGFHFRRAMCMK